MADLTPLMSSARTGDINKDEWRTPAWLYELLDREFKFELDPAATEENALAEWYFDKEQDGLRSKWFGSVYVNPPYSQLKKWVKKGFEEARDNPSVKRVVMLLPARTDTQAWWQYVRFGEVRFLPGRLQFSLGDSERAIIEGKNLDRLAAGKKPLDPENTSAPFPSAIAIFHGGGYLYRPETLYWNVRESTHASSI